MSAKQVKVPPRYARVNAWVISRDTDAEVRFLTTAFGGVETPGSRMLDIDGHVDHIEVEVGDSVIMLFGRARPTAARGASPAGLAARPGSSVGSRGAVRVSRTRSESSCSSWV
jgi:hypothetical protein